jgi:hypothetical protein
VPRVGRGCFILAALRAFQGHWPGAIDPELKEYGAKNLRVMSESAIPDCRIQNYNPVYMVAEKEPDFPKVAHQDF